MSSTTALAPGVPAAPLVEPVEADVLGLDAVGTLGFVVGRRRRLDPAAAEELRAVTHWADLHRVDMWAQRTPRSCSLWSVGKSPLG